MHVLLHTSASQFVTSIKVNYFLLFESEKCFRFPSAPRKSNTLARQSRISALRCSQTAIHRPNRPGNVQIRRKLLQCCSVLVGERRSVNDVEVRRDEGQRERERERESEREREREGEKVVRRRGRI